MHELSIAIGIVEIAREEGARLGGRVSAVHLKVGALAGVAPEALASSYEIAAADTPLAGSRLLIEPVPLEIWCPRCDGLRAPDSIQLFRCPDCGTPSGDVRRGKELEVVALEIET